MVDTLAGRQAEMKMQTLGETLFDVEANAPGHKLFETRQKTLTHVKSASFFERRARKVSKWTIRQLVSHCQRRRWRRWTTNWLEG